MRSTTTIWMRSSSPRSVRGAISALPGRLVLPPPSVERTAAADFLLIVGTLHPASRRQLAALVEQVNPKVWEITITPRLRACGDELPASTNILDLQRSERCLVVTSPATRVTAASALVRDLSATAAQVIRQDGIRRVFVTGGEVARALCDALDITRLALRGQLVDGVPVMVAQGGLPDLELVTKAGGFGDDHTLLSVYAYLAGQDGSS